jgi:hypothetical protein
MRREREGKQKHLSLDGRCVSKVETEGGGVRDGVGIGVGCCGLVHVGKVQKTTRVVQSGHGHAETAKSSVSRGLNLNNRIRSGFERRKKLCLNRVVERSLQEKETRSVERQH